MTYDEAYRAQTKYGEAERVLQRSREQGLIDQQRQADLLDRVRQRTVDAGKAGAAANGNVARSAGLARHEMINLSRQVQDVGVSLASGQSPFTVLVQQGTQVADIFASSQGSLRGFGSQLLSMITPARVAGVGMAALVAVAIAATASWKTFALTLDDTARRANVTTSEMAKLQAIAGFKGISQQDASEGFGQFAGLVYQAQRGRGPLAEQMHYAGVEARTFSDYLGAAADIIKRAQTDQERLVRLQELGLPATMQWVRLLQGGADGLRRAQQEAAKFGGPDNDRMVEAARRFDEAWNKAWTNLALGFRNATGNITAFMDRNGELLRAAAALLSLNPGTAALTVQGAPQVAKGAWDWLKRNSSGADTNPLMEGMRRRLAATNVAGGMYPFAPTGIINSPAFLNPGGLPSVWPKLASPSVQTAAGNGAVDDKSLAGFKRTIELEQQRIGVLGDLATVEERVMQVENNLTLIRRTEPGNKITDEDQRRILEYTRLQALGIVQVRQQADAQRIEAATVGMAAGEAAAYRAEWEKRLEFMARGIALSPENLRLIQQEARALGEVTDALEKRRIQERISTEGQTMFLSDADKRIAQELLPIYGSLDRAMASMEASQLRQIENWKQVKEATSGIVSGIGSAVLQGKNLGDVLRQNVTNVAGRWIDKQLEQGINAAIGIGAKGAGLGLSSVSTPMMTVTATSVTIGGVPVTMAGLGGLPGVTPPGTAGGVGSGISASAAFNWAQGGSLTAAAQAIKNIESSGGNYQALGPWTRGDRAYGAYQIMGNNIGPWSEAALGYRMTPQQFLADPAAQDAIFQHRFGGYMDKYGNRAASAWFAGEGGMKNAGATDSLGTSVAAYQAKFDANMKQLGGTMDGVAMKTQALGTNIQAVGTATQTTAVQTQSAATSMTISAQQLGQVGSAVGSMIGIVGASLSKSPTARAIFMGATPLLSVLGKGLFTALGGFDDGGYTGAGPRWMPKGVVHAGEVVWSQDDIRRGGGVAEVEAMRRGRRQPIVIEPPAAAAAPPAYVSNVTFNGPVTEDNRAWVLDELDRRDQVILGHFNQVRRAGADSAHRSKTGVGRSV